jgi:hypothetical protein
VAAVAEKWQQRALDRKEIRLTPRKADIQIKQFGLLWIPYWQLESEGQPVRRVRAYT